MRFFFSFLIAIFFIYFFVNYLRNSVVLVRMAKRRARVQIPGDRCVFSWLIWDLYLIIMTFKVWWNSRVAITWTKGKQSMIIIIVFHPKFALPTIFFCVKAGFWKSLKHVMLGSCTLKQNVYEILKILFLRNFFICMKKLHSPIVIEQKNYVKLFSFYSKCKWHHTL